MSDTTRRFWLWLAVLLFATACASATDSDPVADRDLGDRDLGDNRTDTAASSAEAKNGDDASDRADPTPQADSPEVAASAAAEEATSTPIPSVAEPAPSATPIEDPIEDPLGLPQGFGRYLVAKPGAGERWFGEIDERWDSPTRIIPVYDEPDGPKRMLIESNSVDGVEYPMPLYNWTANGSPTVLRVTAGLEGHSFVQVQAPTRPHHRTVWVRASDFEWAETTRRIEIDLAGPGELRVYDGDEVLLSAPIVQGRNSRVTPTHVTYLTEGRLSAIVAGTSPAYGDAMLRMASFSEVLGTFGAGGSPENFLHGTDAPELMGQRVSSGEIRLTNADLHRVVELVHPGTPIVIFDSSRERADRESVLRRVSLPAQTMPLVTNAVGTSATMRAHPQLWVPCDEPARVCPHPEPERTERSFRYAIVAHPDSDAQILVFDEPGRIAPHTR